MPSPTPAANQTTDTVPPELAELRGFSGPPKDFWPRYLACVGSLIHAGKVAVLLQSPGQPAAWKRMAEWPATLAPSGGLTAFLGELEGLAARCAGGESTALTWLGGAPARGAGACAVAVRVRLHRATEVCVLAAYLPEVSEPEAREALLRLRLTADVPESYQSHQALRQANAGVERMAVAHDLMVSVNREKRFLAAALALCNGLASHLHAERVSLGWLEGGYVRLRSMSRTEQFDRQMAAAVGLEAAMDEALDQDEEILWPRPEDSTAVSRDHESFARGQQVGHMCSLPLRVDDRAVAVVTCERRDKAFEPGEVEQLRLCCDQATRRLSDLHRRDRWVGARLSMWAREQCSVVLGPQHTWAKALALVVVLALAALFLVRVPYRVEGSFVLKSDEAAFRSAPFDGYIDQVFVRPGDVVKAGDPLFRLVTRELDLERQSADADLSRFQREMEKARATNGLSEMRVAQALSDQARARLELVSYRLNEATVRAPFESVVVEGDWKERLAAPVKQGDPIMKVARLESLYVEAEVNERDVHEILASNQGEIAFVSQPKLKFPVQVVKVEPAAFPRPSGNVFLVRCRLPKGIEPWWRPGMSGLCKLSVEKRVLWWVLTHRTVDFLRMQLWW